MIKLLRHTIRRPISAIVVLSLVVFMFALAACGDSGSGSASTSSAANNSTAAMTVTIKETKGASGGDVYACDPTTLSVKKGDSVTFTNASDEVQDFSTAGDAQKAGVSLKLDLNASSTATFNTPGTFMLESGKKATVSVTVQ